MKIDGISNLQTSMPTAADSLSLKKDTKLSKACDQFEGMIVRQILSDGMKPMLAQPLGSGSTGSGTYDYMVTDTLANGISGKNAMGISHLLQAQFAPHHSAKTAPLTHS